MWPVSSPITFLDGHPRPCSLSLQASWVLTNRRTALPGGSTSLVSWLPQEVQPLPASSLACLLLLLSLCPTSALLFLVDFFGPSSAPF